MTAGYPMRKCVAVFKLFACRNEAMLIKRHAFLMLDSSFKLSMMSSSSRVMVAPVSVLTKT
eukprot:6039757-Karenia_brevis.AAC.1